MAQYNLRYPSFRIFPSKTLNTKREATLAEY